MRTYLRLLAYKMPNPKRTKIQNATSENVLPKSQSKSDFDSVVVVPVLPVPRRSLE